MFPADLDAALDRLWSTLPDETFAAFLAAVPDPELRLLPEVAQRLLARWAPDQPPNLPTIEALSVALTTSLTREAGRRKRRSETAAGAVIGQWLATDGQAITSDDLRTLLAARPHRRRFHPDGAHEVDAMYLTAVVEKVAELADRHFARDLREQFLWILQGGFNGVPAQADNRVRDRLARYLKLRAWEAGGDDALAAEDAAQVIAEYRSSKRPPEEPTPTLIALIDEAPLTPREREAITLRCIQEHTQAVTAQRMGVSQPRVAQLEAAAREKLRVAWSRIRE